MFKRTKKGMCWVLIIAMLLMMLPNPTLALAEEAAVAQAIPGEIDRVDFNDDWQFYLATRNPSVVGGNNGPNFADNGLEDAGDYTTAEIIAPSFDDSSWRTLNVPHDWSIEGERVSSGSSSAQAYLQGGLGYYRKSFVLPASMQGQKHVSIDFEGVYQNSDVYVNGQLVGNYPSGYTGFTYDITEYLTFGDDKPNVIVVKVQNMSSSGRWYTGSGIVRPVTLVVTGKTRFVRNGVVITTPTVEQDYKANGTSYMTVKANAFSDDSNGVVAIKTTIYDASGAVVLTKTSDFIDSNPSTPIEISDEFVVPNVHLWSMEDPYRYTIQTDLLYERNGGDGTIETVDSTTNKFGFRWFRIDNDEGFFLNDKYAKFQGVDLHHDQGALGAAGTYDAFKRQMTILQTMGVNAYRSSHNPPSKAMIDVCSELGIVVMEEAYDGWGSAKATYDFGRFFMKDIPADWAGSLTPISEHTVWSDWVIKEMVARDINEPSIVMWSIGNEVRGVGTRPSWYNWTDYLKEGDIVPGNYTATSYNEYTETLRLRNAIKSVDTSRYVVIGGDQERSVPSNTSVWHYINYALDGYGLNYNTAESVDGLHAKYADTAFFFESESSSQTGARGVYFNPSMAQTGVNQTPGKRGTSAYDNNFASWTMPNEYGLKKDRDREFFLGQFIWSGFDYLGEPTPYNVYPVAISSFGCIDTAGFFKDSYYLYKSQWNNEPMAHIVPMNWNDWRIGEEVEVWVNTNAVKAELFLNGESLGTKSFDVKETTYGKTYLETTENTKDNRLNSTDTNTGGYVSPNGSHGKLHLTWMVPFAPGELKAVAMDAEGNVVATDIMKTADQAYTINMKPEKSVIQADGRSLVYIEADIVDENGVMLPSAGNLVKFDVEGGTIVGVDNGKQESTELYKWENVEKNSHSERSAYNGKVLVIVQSEKGNTGEISITASSENMVSSNVKVLATEDGTGDYTPVCVPAELGDVESIDTVNFALETGKAPVLPIDVKVNYESGFTQMKKVTWAGISNEKFAVPGSFEVLGVVDGIEGINAKAMITVSAASEETIDIALNTEAGTQDTYSETGALATASFTNGTSYPNLMLNGNGSNSWTNKYSANQTVVLALVRNSHPYEFVEVYWPSAKTMGKIDLHFVVGGSNPSSNLPKSLNVQYWDGFEWKNATNQNVEWAEVSNEATNITFDRVMTSRIRVGMENETPYSATTGAMQISQFKVFDEAAIAATVTTPTASVESGTYDAEQSVVLSSETEGADIYYTIDGSIPTTESTKYTEPIIISENITLKAIAVKSGMVDSAVVEFNYIIEEPTIPVSTISVVGENDKDNIDIGNTLQMNATVNPSDATDQSITWAVYNEDGSETNIATINNNGLLTALKDGKVMVVASANDESGVTGSVIISINPRIVLVESPKSIVEVNDLTTIEINAKDAVDLYAFDLSFKFDTSLFELEEIVVNEDYTLGDVGVVIGEDGNIRLIGTLKGAEEGLSGEVNIATLSFKAKDVHAIGSFNLALGSMLADRDGILFNLPEASKDVVVTQADITGDGKVNISDLVLIAKAFGKEEGMQGYEARFDMNLDKVIDIQDLAYVALKVMK